MIQALNQETKRNALLLCMMMNKLLKLSHAHILTHLENFNMYTHTCTCNKKLVIVIIRLLQCVLCFK